MPKQVILMISNLKSRDEMQKDSSRGVHSAEASVSAIVWSCGLSARSVLFANEGAASSPGNAVMSGNTARQEALGGETYK